MIFIPFFQYLDMKNDWNAWYNKDTGILINIPLFLLKIISFEKHLHIIQINKLYVNKFYFNKLYVN